MGDSWCRVAGETYGDTVGRVPTAPDSESSSKDEIPGGATPEGLVANSDSSGERMVCIIEMPSPIRSKSNYRRARTGTKRGGDWAQHRAFEDELALMARLARPQGWPLGDADLPVAQRPLVVVLIAARTLLDTANMAKSVTDALEGVLFVNDASVRHVACISVRSRNDQSTTIMVEVLSAGAAMAAIFQAAERLAADYQAQAPSGP